MDKKEILEICTSVEDTGIILFEKACLNIFDLKDLFEGKIDFRSEGARDLIEGFDDNLKLHISELKDETLIHLINISFRSDDLSDSYELTIIVLEEAIRRKSIKVEEAMARAFINGQKHYEAGHRYSETTVFDTLIDDIFAQFEESPLATVLLGTRNDILSVSNCGDAVGYLFYDYFKKVKDRKKAEKVLEKYKDFIKEEIEIVDDYDKKIILKKLKDEAYSEIVKDEFLEILRTFESETMNLRIKAMGNFFSENSLSTEVLVERESNNEHLSEQEFGNIIATLISIIKKMQDLTAENGSKSGLSEFNFEIEIYDESDNVLASFDERRIFEEAVKYESLLDLTLDYVQVTGLGKYMRIWINEEIPLGTFAILALVEKDKKWIVNYIDFLRSSDLDHEVYQGKDIENILRKYGWCDETSRLAVARAVSCAGQFGFEDFETFFTNGLNEYINTADNRSYFFNNIIQEFSELHLSDDYLSGLFFHSKERYEEKIKLWLENFEPVLRAEELLALKKHIGEMWDSFNEIKERIKKYLFKLLSNRSAKVLVAEINTYVVNDSFVPFLDIFSFKSIKGKKDFQEAVEKANENDEYGYIDDILDNVEWIEEEINVGEIYSKWPRNIDESDAFLKSILKEIVMDNRREFSKVELFYFHHIDELDLEIIINKSYN